MAAYAALVSLMNNLDQLKNYPCLVSSFNKFQIASIGEKINFFLHFVESYNNCVSREEAEELESQIASTAHEAEDVIESHIVDQILPRSTENSDVYLRRRCVFGLQKVILDMRSLKRKILRLEEERDITDQKPENSISEWRSQDTNIGRAAINTVMSRMVGFDAELMQLKDVLTGQQLSRQIISIVGMGGMGKTTLAKNVYQDSVIMHHFDLRAWATISQEYNVRDILLQLLSGLGKFTNETEEKLSERLHKSLFGRRYLITLDDVWSVDVWDKVKFLFPDNGNGSRIVVTTRLSNLATHLCSFCVRIEFLDEHKSWNLFCQEVFGEEDCPLKLVGIGKKIVEQCKGLPLSIVVIAGLLRYNTEEYWQNVAKNINSTENSECLDVFYLSYNHMPPHLMPCFLYMGTYPEDSTIAISEIVKLWVAEGFLKPNGVQMLEEIGEDYVKDLIERNLILVCGYHLNGKIKSCRIHDLLREVCIKVANKEKFFHVLRTNNIPRGTDKERGLVFHKMASSTCHNKVFEVLQLASLARSLICNVSEVPVECRLLRVMKKAYNWSMEAEFELVNLRYISYQANWDGSMFPSTLSLIWNLQTLIIKRRNLKTVSPLDIWNMTQLRHVKGCQVLLPDPPPSEEDDASDVLANLQTLKVVVNFRLSEEACKRIPNVKKLHLMYGDIWKGYDEGLYESLRNLRRLHKLESLNMSCSETTRFSIHELKNAVPSSLSKLSLEDCYLNWEDLSAIIGRLPKLQVLKLRDARSVEECEWSCVEGGFRSLKFLQIELCALESWTLDSVPCFPVLEKLLLVNLKDLKEIPFGFAEILTLQLISLEHCSVSAALSAVKIKQEQETFGSDDLQIQIQMFDVAGKKLTKMVKMGGLPINKIHLQTW